ncbi:MAG: glycosyltransferase family 4 protein [Flavobacteriaceae bacterium]|nr:glycosyltransferase family 4 protein [Flavobacteriaceae bacterium]
MKQKEKIAVVVQRFGKDINGGAEYHAKLLCDQLKKYYKIDVLTTRSIDYQIWDNTLPEKDTIEGDITIKRFNSLTKNTHKANKNFRKLAGKRRHHNFLKKIKLFKLYKRLGLHYVSNLDKKNWIKFQGPNCPDLVSYVIENKEEYKVFIFFTYLYYPTYFGIQSVKNNILIPTAHDEPSFYFSGYENVFNNASFIMYNSLSEKRLVENTYPKTKQIKNDVAGVGFEPIKINSKNDLTLPSYKYLLYVGRIDVSKGCDILLDFFEKYKQESNNDLKLVMIGKNFMDINKEYKNVIFTGFISDDEKDIYLNNCQALVIPSFYESLSLVTLEAMQFGKPVIANKDCEVLKDHIEMSNAGFLYKDYNSFKNKLNLVNRLTKSEKEEISIRGKQYIEENYKWDVIVNKFINAINKNN